MLLKEPLEILIRVAKRTGSLWVAYKWFRGTPIPGFDGMTAERLVHEGRVDHVRAYLDEIEDGGYA